MTKFGNSGGRDCEIAVVAVETTGCGRQDRIIEIAIVCIDTDGTVTDEFSTLVDPQRNVGAVEVHGITAEMVAGAPTFASVAGAVARRLDGRIFASHNARFASRFVDKELRRVGLELSLGRAMSTLRLTGSRLNLACSAAGIDLADDHRALDAARATAQLLHRFDQGAVPFMAAAVFGRLDDAAPQLACRPSTSPTLRSDLQEVVSRVQYPTEGPLALAYLDALDWVLNAQAIDTIEPERLEQLALDFGVSAAEQVAAHDHYLDAVIAAVEVDGSISRRGHAVLARIAHCLGRPWPQLTPTPTDPQPAATGTVAA